MKSLPKRASHLVILVSEIILALAMPSGLSMTQATTDQHSSAVPSFEVAAVRPVRNESAGTHFGIAPGRFNAENATAEELIKFAYNVRTNDGIDGEPRWASLEKFDVDARIPDAEVEAMQKLQPSQRLQQYRLMVQSLLKDRFELITSTQIKQLPVYALVVAKNGPKLTLVEASRQHIPGLSGGSKGELHASSVSMALFADWISGNPDIDGRAVVDHTGLKGSYDFMLTWTRTGGGVNPSSASPISQPVPSSIPADQDRPSIFTALQEQLGLKLEPAKGPVQVVVIDRLEEPSPN